jgi:hypothetical protein
MRIFNWIIVLAILLLDHFFDRRFDDMKISREDCGFGGDWK